MIVLTSSKANELAAIMKSRADMGLLISPSHFYKPDYFDGLPYACDNDAYGAWRNHQRGLTHETPDQWWSRVGGSKWCRMLDKIPAEHPPLFVLLPDVVGDWAATLERGALYWDHLRHRGLPVALALQDGCVFEEALRLEPDWVFIGGTTAWKWRTAEPAVEFFQPRGIRVHVGRCGGRIRIRECLRLGVDSCDSTGFSRFWKNKMAWLTDELDGKYEQLYLF